MTESARRLREATRMRCSLRNAPLPLGGEHLVGHRIVDQARDQDSFALERNGNGELRDAVQEIRGAVERIDDPGVRLVGAFAASTFLAQETVTRPCLGKFGVERFFGAAVGGRDEIGRTLERDLQVLDLAEIALERARRLAGGGNHDVEEGGAQHGPRGLPARACAVKSAEPSARPPAISSPPSRRPRALRAFAWKRTGRSQGRWHRRPWK